MEDWRCSWVDEAALDEPGCRAPVARGHWAEVFADDGGGLLWGVLCCFVVVVVDDDDGDDDAGDSDCECMIDCAVPFLFLFARVLGSMRLPLMLAANYLTPRSYLAPVP